MQVLKEDIRGRILAVAEQRFGQQGYSKTSMREIAGAVGVGVGNIYNYFRNKDELFCEVVRPVLHAMEAMLQEHHGIRGEDVMTMRSEKYLKACIDEYVSLIETHRSLLEILLFRAQGSSLEHFRESYTDRSTGLVKAWFAAMKKKYPSNPQPIGFSGILLAKRQNSFYCTYFLHNRNVADTKSPYPIKRLEVIRWFNQKSMVFNQSLS